MRAEEGASFALFLECAMNKAFVTTGMILLLAALFCGCPSKSKVDQATYLAEVNGQSIAREQFIAELHDSRAGNTEPLPSDPVTWLQVKVAFLDQMVERLLIEQEAVRRQITVTDQDEDDALARMRSDWPKDQFENVLAERQITADHLRQAIRHDLLTGLLAKKAVLPGIDVPEPEVQGYYRMHADEFSRPEQVRARQILVKSEAEAAELLTRILTGGSFVELAREHSISPEADKGGDLGYFGRGQMPLAVENACFALDVHQVSDIIHSQYGYHLFYLESHRSAAVIPLNNARSQIVHKLRDEKSDQAWQRFLADLKSSAQIEINEAVLASIKQEEI